VDWDALERAHRAGDIDGVAIRASFGTVRADSSFARNQREARARGIPVIYYHFAYPAYNTAAAEAAMFNGTVGPLEPAEAMCGDFEDDPSAHQFPRGNAGQDWVRAFLAALEAPQNASWGYSYPSLISEVGLQVVWEGGWPFWLADYSATADGAFDYAIARQVTDCGTTPGVSGCCDQSRVLQAPLGRWLTATSGGREMAEGFMSPDPASDWLQELFLGPDQTVYFADYGQGGAGGFEAYNGPIGSFGAPAGHKLVRIGGTYTQYQGQQRLNVWAVTEDGQRWAKVIRYVQPYDVLQDWAPTASPTLAFVPTSATDDDSVFVTQATYSGHQHSATVSGTTSAPK